MSSKRIMMVSPYALKSSDGGVQRSTLQMGEYFSQLGWPVAYVSLSTDDHDVPEGHVHFRPDKDLQTESDQAIFEFLDLAAKEFKPDVIFNQVGLPEQPAKAIQQLKERHKKLLVIACFRNSPAFYRSRLRPIGRRPRWYQLPQNVGIACLYVYRVAALAIHRFRTARLFKRAMQRCDRLMLLAPSYTDDLRWYLRNLDSSKILTVPNGYVQPDNVDSKIKRNELLYVGRIKSEQKNVMVLPDIWKEVSEKCENWEFHIVGYGRDTEQLIKRFASLKCQNVYFHERQRADAFFQRAKLFIMTSTYEGFANTLIEAQMHGVVPVAFRSFSAVDWMVNDRSDAVLVSPYNVQEFSNHLISLMTDEELRLRMAEKARINARRFSAEAVGRQWERILTKLTDEARN